MSKQKPSATKASKASVKVRSSVPTRPVTAHLGHDVAPLVERVVAIVEEARAQVVRTVNSSMLIAYWHIGRAIVEFVQRGTSRAEYGEHVLEGLSASLRRRVGRGYSLRNLRNFRAFYHAFSDREPVVRDAQGEFGRRHLPNVAATGALQIRQTSPAEFVEPSGFSDRLGWSHYLVLSKVTDLAARSFYELEATSENWPVEHLERQIHTQLHLRLLKSRNKNGVMELARRGQAVERPVDLIKSPVVLDFLDLPDHEELRESDLESAIISKLSHFLLELGKGFAFVGRQKRISFEDDDFFIDLVFYNVILKCHLLIDLKLGKLTYQDVGQMDGYVRLFDAEGRTPGDGPTIGLILCAEKNETIAHYSILNEHKQLFAAKYVTYLPTEEELRRELERDRRIAEAIISDTVMDAPRAKKPAKPKRASRSRGSRKR